MSADRLILVDLDGVVVDLMGYAHREGFLCHPACRWDLHKCCTVDLSLDGLFAHTHLFKFAPAIDDAIPGVKRLMEHARVHFASTPWPSNPNSAAAKYRWIERYGFRPDMLTLTHDKALISAVALIDDKPGLSGPWTHVEYPQAWNSGEALGIPTWSDGLADYVIERFHL